MGLLNIEYIKQLKARYFSALDTKDWQLMHSCLSKECEAIYDSGKYRFAGREEIINFF